MSHSSPSQVLTVELYVGLVLQPRFIYSYENAPCIIFVDEIDAVGRQRCWSAGNDERNKHLTVTC